MRCSQYPGFRLAWATAITTRVSSTTLVRHEEKREALKRKLPDGATELGVDEGGAGVRVFSSVPNGILVCIEEDATEAITLLVVPMSSELDSRSACRSNWNGSIRVRT